MQNQEREEEVTLEMGEVFGIKEEGSLLLQLFCISCYPLTRIPVCVFEKRKEGSCLFGLKRTT